MNAYSWTPSQSVRKWKNMGIYFSGTTYTGIPYSQTEYQCSISSVSWIGGRYFDLEKEDSNSGFYDDYTRTLHDPPEVIVMPKYGNDCSGYVSISWDIGRETTVGISSHNLIGKTTESRLKQYARMSPGDALVVSGSHTFIIKTIEAINDSNGNLLKLKFTCNEQTPYNCRTSTIYSDGCSEDDYKGVCKALNLAQDYSWDWCFRPRNLRVFLLDCMTG